MALWGFPKASTRIMESLFCFVYTEEVTRVWAFLLERRQGNLQESTRWTSVPGHARDFLGKAARYRCGLEVSKFGIRA